MVFAIFLLLVSELHLSRVFSCYSMMLFHCGCRRDRFVCFFVSRGTPTCDMVLLVYIMNSMFSSVHVKKCYIKTKTGYFRNDGNMFTHVIYVYTICDNEICRLSLTVSTIDFEKYQTLRTCWNFALSKYRPVESLFNCRLTYINIYVTYAAGYIQNKYKLCMKEERLNRI